MGASVGVWCAVYARVIAPTPNLLDRSLRPGKRSRRILPRWRVGPACAIQREPVLPEYAGSLNELKSVCTRMRPRCRVSYGYSSACNTESLGEGSGYSSPLVLVRSGDTKAVDDCVHPCAERGKKVMNQRVSLELGSISVVRTMLRGPPGNCTVVSTE